MQEIQVEKVLKDKFVQLSSGVVKLNVVFPLKNPCISHFLIVFSSGKFRKCNYLLQNCGNLETMYRVGKKKYDCLNWYNICTKRACNDNKTCLLTFSAMSNLNYDICHAHFHAILTKIRAFKQE